MKKNKFTITDSHEVFCHHLKESIKSYSNNELELFLAKYKNRNSYMDYYNIYVEELEKRNKL